MKCEQINKHLSAYIDNELSQDLNDEIAEHLSGCKECSAMLGELFTVQKRIVGHVPIDAPDGLLEKIKMDLSVQSQNKSRRAWLPKRVLGPALTAAVPALIIGWSIGSISQTAAIADSNRTQQFVAAHVRSQMVDHLMDVQSADGHTVKPWFQGKLNFSPPVLDLSEDGYALLGGRLDYVNDEHVASLVYKRRQHVINLFIGAQQGDKQKMYKRTVQGYNTLAWQINGLDFWVVSDLNMRELNGFVKLYQVK